MTKSENIYYPKGEIEKTFINSIWRLSEHDLNIRKEIILPKGTVEIIFNFSERITYFNPTSQVLINLPTVFVNGINFKPFELIKTGKQYFLGIQLKSIGLKLLFNVSAKEFNDNVFDGKDICSELDSLAEKLFDNQIFSQQVEIIIKWIKNKTSILKYRYQIDRAIKLININCNQNLTVKDLSRGIFLSDRQLRRFAVDWLGMNTEEFISYKKYLICLYLLHKSNLNLTEIALEAGYYDQSHFIREFKSYTNLTPRQYRKVNKSIPGHILL